MLKILANETRNCHVRPNGRYGHANTPDATADGRCVQPQSLCCPPEAARIGRGRQIADQRPPSIIASPATMRWPPSARGERSSTNRFIGALPRLRMARAEEASGGTIVRQKGQTDCCRCSVRYGLTTSMPVEIGGRVSGIGRIDFNAGVFQFGSQLNGPAYSARPSKRCSR